MAQMDLMAAERQAAILDRVRRDGRVLASELAIEFETSEDTIRRALRELAERGLCRRVYGGALAISPSSESIVFRNAESIDRKAALGAAMAELVTKGQFVYIDGGTTNLAAARMIPKDFGLTVATQDPAIAALLATREDVTLILIGGQVKPQLGSAVGVEATRQMMDLRPDLLFLGLCALDPETGVWSFDAEDAAFKQCLVKNSRKTVAAALNEKLDASAPFRVCPLESIETLIVEPNAPRRAIKPFVARGLRVKTAKPQSQRQP
jgi:DeoR/GlpR family transcriptional regulator of sugar metabolism